MSAMLQSIIALAIVAIAAALLLRSWFGKRRKPGCGSESCAAVSPEVKKLQKSLRKP